MALSFTRNRLISAAVIVAWLPSVAPIDYNTCKGGLVAQTCQVESSSHCCKSGGYLSATCCWNSCSFPIFFNSGTVSCYGITNSMCCSTKSLGSESCCNYASYSRTSTSSTNGDYTRITYRTCHGGPTVRYCTNRLSTSCCSLGYLDSASCCRHSTCVRTYGFYTETCSTTSTFCCSSSQSCCNAYAYNDEASSGNVVGAIVGGVFGGIILLVIIIVVPISVVCCCTSGTGGTWHTNNTVSDTASSNQAHHHPAHQPPSYEYQPPSFQNHQPPPFGFSQPMDFGNQQ